MDLYEPGPDAIGPDLAPRGVVFHLYDTAGELLAVDAVTPPGAGPGPRILAALLGAPGPLCLVCYDGDTGDRFTPAQYAAAGLKRGEQT